MPAIQPDMQAPHTPEIGSAERPSSRQSSTFAVPIVPEFACTATTTS